MGLHAFKTQSFSLPAQASTFSINLAVELYRMDLELYAHKGLPRYFISRSFGERPDSAYLYLVRQCPFIHTLVSLLEGSSFKDEVFSMEAPLCMMSLFRP